MSSCRLHPRLVLSPTPRHTLRRTPWPRPLSIDSAARRHPTLPSPPPPILTSADSRPPQQPGPLPDGPGQLSDQEWEIRTGRAIYILQQTLPTFFSTGLISSLDVSSPQPVKKNDEDLPIYSPNIRLEYRPPIAFPHPFPRTLHVEGLPLYLGSSAFVRHTLNALYTDLHVELRRVRVHGPRASSGTRPDCPNVEPDGLPHHEQRGNTPSIREKSLFLGLYVHGTNRVSKAEGGWEVNSTYTFSPTTGLIHLHNIDSIHPAPHQAFFSALQAALTKLGLGGTQQTGAPTSQSRALPPSPDRS